MLPFGVIVGLCLQLVVGEPVKGGKVTPRVACVEKLNRLGEARLEEHRRLKQEIKGEMEALDMQIMALKWQIGVAQKAVEDAKQVERQMRLQRLIHP